MSTYTFEVFFAENQHTQCSFKTRNLLERKKNIYHNFLNGRYFALVSS